MSKPNPGGSAFLRRLSKSHTRNLREKKAWQVTNPPFIDSYSLHLYGIFQTGTFDYQRAML
jgi:hypothetical protein